MSLATEPCPDPTFPFNGGTYGPCSTCGHLAWDHLESDPYADIIAQQDFVYNGGFGQPPAPVMKVKT